MKSKKSKGQPVDGSVTPNLKNEYVDVIFCAPCDFLNKPRVKGDKETVTLAHAKALHFKQLIEEF